MKRICLGVLLLSAGGSTFANIHDRLTAIAEDRVLSPEEQVVPPSVLAGLRIVVDEEHPVPTPKVSPSFHPISPPVGSFSPTQNAPRHPITPPCQMRPVRRQVPYSRTRSGSNSHCFFGNR